MTVVQKMWGLENGQTYRLMNRTENPETDPHKYKNLINDRGGNENHLGNTETIQ